MGNIYTTLWQIYSETTNQISSQLSEICGRYYKENILVFFSGHSIHRTQLQDSLLIFPFPISCAWPTAVYTSEHAVASMQVSSKLLFLQTVCLSALQQQYHSVIDVWSQMEEIVTEIGLNERRGVLGSYKRVAKCRRNENGR